MPIAVISTVTVAVFEAFPLVGFTFRILVALMERACIL